MGQAIIKIWAAKSGGHREKAWLDTQGNLT